MQCTTCVIRVTWHWGHPSISFCFVLAHKSIVLLLLTINCALKFYSLFMMCNVIWFMWTLWVTGSNCECFRGSCPCGDLQSSSCQSTFSSFQTLHCWTPDLSQSPSLRTDGERPKLSLALSYTWKRQASSWLSNKGNNGLVRLFFRAVDSRSL